jgi:hypothetical protein
MFAATPRLRDRLDLRTVAIVAIVAFGAFGLQLALLAGTVASPLGGALAGFDRSAEGTPIQAVADADGGREPNPGVAGGARLAWERPAEVGVEHQPLPAECLVYR